MEFIFGWIAIISAVVYILTVFVKPFALRKRVKEYERGLKLNVESKEELFRRFKDLNSFLIKQVYYNQNGDVEVVGKVGKHTFLLENGVVKSAGVSAFSDKKVYKLVIEEMALLDFLAKEEDPSLPINPYTRYKFGKNLGLTQTVSGCMIFISVILLALTLLIPKSETYIEMVKTATPENYPDVTYEEAFESFFVEPEWRHFSSDQGEVVQFTGEFSYLGKEAEACFQYVIDLENASFTLQYFGIDDVSQDLLTTGIALETIFSSYNTFEEEIVQDNGMNEYQIESEIVTDEINISDGMYYSSDEISYMDIAGRYLGSYGAEISLSMYSSIEDMYVGSIQIQTLDTNYSGEVIQLGTNIYQVETVEGVYIVFGVSQNMYGDIEIDLFINNEQIDFLTMVESYIS